MNLEPDSGGRTDQLMGEWKRGNWQIMAPWTWPLIGTQSSSTARLLNGNLLRLRPLWYSCWKNSEKHPSFNQMKALVVAISEYIAKFRYQLFSTDTACWLQRSGQSANYSDVCRGGKKWISTRKLAPPPRAARPAAQPRSRDQCQKHDLGVTALSPSSAVSRTRRSCPGLSDVLCLMCRVVCCCLMCCLMFHVLSVLSDVWRSGRCLHPPRQGGGCVCLDISADRVPDTAGLLVYLGPI